jgi:hypothetical protein
MKSSSYVRAFVVSGLLTFAGTSAFGDAYLDYSRPPSDAGSQAYVGQVVDYPAFRPVRSPEPVSQPERAPPPPPPSTPTEDNIILNTGGTVQVVPRSELNNQ